MPVDPRAFLPQHPEVPQVFELRRIEPRSDADMRQVAEDAFVEAVVGVAGGDQARQRQRIVDAPAQDSGAVEVEHLVEEHLGRAEEAGAERFAAALGVHQGRGAPLGADVA